MWEQSDTRTLWRYGGVEVTHVSYHAERYGFGQPVLGDADAVVLMRRGAYRRRADGLDHVADTRTGFFRRRNEEVSVANFTGEAEEFDIIELSPALLDELLADATLPGGPIRISNEMDQRHRDLISATLRGDDDEAILERALELAASAVALRTPGTVRGGRRNTEFEWRRLVSDACELLHLRNGSVTVRQIGRTVGCSPFHLSRVFQAVTGTTISRYRMQLRVRAALHGLCDAESLTELANAVGFSDHSHMTRSLVSELGAPPSLLRSRALSPHPMTRAASGAKRP